MGEIGISRHEFLYELKLKDIILITRGYWRRYHPGWEQARLIAYHAAHAMGCKHAPPPMSQWLTFPWEKPDLPDDDEIEYMRQRIQQENNRKK